MAKIIKTIKYFSHRIKLVIPIVKLFPSYLKDSFKNRILHLDKNDKNIVFTFDDEYLFRDDDSSGRESYYVLKAFSDGGYNVYFYRPDNFRNYWRLSSFGRLIYGIKNLKFISRIPIDINKFIYAFDTIRPDLLNLPWKKVLYINIKKAVTSQVGNVIPMQFYMMPYIYASQEDKNLETYRVLRRKCRIFFGGNLNANYYDSPVFKQKYPHLMTRLEGMQSVIDAGLDLWLIKEKNDFKKFFDSHEYLNRLVVIDTGTNKFPIEPRNWLRIVGQSDFFICFSGTDYPMCHNAIEAMAVGSIPILAYADWFDPQLEHGKNAIIYSDKKDMIQKIKLVLQMTKEEIQNLRKGVLEYYDNYLGSGCLARKYEQHMQSISTLMLFTRFVSDPSKEIEAQNFIQKFEGLNLQEKALNDKN